MKLTRRQAVVGAVAGAVGAGGIYELVDQLTGGAPSRADTATTFREQHLLDGIRVVHSNGIEALVPPLHHEVVTARLPSPASDLRDAQGELDYAARLPRPRLHAVARRARRHRRLGAAVLPAPRPGRAAPAPARPARRQARADRCAPLPERPARHTLESNDVAILLRSDARATSTMRRAPPRLELFHFTSDSPRVRGRRLRRWALVAEAHGARRRIPGADLIPKRPSSSSASRRPRRPGWGRGDRELRDARLRRFPRQRLLPPRDAHAPLAHPRGCGGVVHQLRVRRARRDGVQADLQVQQDTQTVRQGPKDVRALPTSQRDYRSYRAGSGTARRSRRRRVSCATSSPPTGRCIRREQRFRARRLQLARQPVRVVGAS